MREGSSAFKILTDKPRRKIPIGRPRGRRKDNIRMEIKEIDKKKINLWLSAPKGAPPVN